MTAISRYFKLYEVEYSYTAFREEISNRASSQVIECAKALGSKVLDSVRVEFGAFTPTSWFRCEELEKVIARKGYARFLNRNRTKDSKEMWEVYFEKKQHPKGLAVDIKILGVGTETLFNWIKNNLEFDQLICEFYKVGQPHSGWVHVSYVTGDNRNKAFRVG